MTMKPNLFKTSQLGGLGVGENENTSGLVRIRKNTRGYSKIYVLRLARIHHNKSRYARIHKYTLGYGRICQDQGNLFTTINCGGHIGKVGQSQTKLDNFETNEYLMTILGKNLGCLWTFFEESKGLFWEM